MNFTDRSVKRSVEYPVTCVGLVVLEQVVLAGLIGVLVVVDEPALEAEEVIEPMAIGTELRLVAQVPLADEPGAVAVVLQQLRQCAACGAQPLVGRPTCGTKRILDPVSLLIAAADEHGARRRTIRRGVEVGQPRAGLGEAVDARRLDVRGAVAADVAVAHVVSDDENHVRTRGCRLVRQRAFAPTEARRRPGQQGALGRRGAAREGG